VIGVDFDFVAIASSFANATAVGLPEIVGGCYHHCVAVAAADAVVSLHRC